MLKIEVTAPGKAILHGEHAVVYGKAAVAVSLGLKSTVKLVSNLKEVVSLSFLSLTLDLSWSLSDLIQFSQQLKGANGIYLPDADLLNEVNLFLLKTTNLDKNGIQSQKLAAMIFLYLFLSINKSSKERLVRPLSITVDTELCIGAGMGSSASYSVCVATALLAASGQIDERLPDEDRKKISDWAFRGEQIAHGRPSGIDNSICSYGGALLFKDFEIASILPNMPLLKILLVSTGVERNTKNLVQNVKQKSNLYPTVISQVMSAIDAISIESWELLKSMASIESISTSTQAFQDLIKMNQCLLNCLNVSHPKLNEICSIAQKHGCSAKLTGAGGGGCAFILLPFDENSKNTQVKELKAELSSLEYEFWDVSLGGPGVTLKMS